MPRYLVERELGAGRLVPADEEHTEIWCVVIDGDAAGCVIWAHATSEEFGQHYSRFDAPTPWAIAHGPNRRHEQRLADSLRLEAGRHR